MSFILSEDSKSSSIPSDVNVVWNKKFKTEIKKKNLSIYDGGCVEIPSTGTLEGFLDSFYTLKRRVVEAIKVYPKEEGTLLALEQLIEVCIDDSIGTQGFDFPLAYKSVGSMFKNIIQRKKNISETSLKTPNSKLFSLLSSGSVCPYCGVPISRYPYIEVQRCPNCGLNIKTTVYDALIPRKRNAGKPMDLRDHLKNIRKEIKKRAPLYGNLKKMAFGESDRNTSLKAAMSCLTRIAIEDEMNPGKNILEFFGKPLLIDINNIFLGENLGQVQESVGSYFTGEI